MPMLLGIPSAPSICIRLACATLFFFRHLEGSRTLFRPAAWMLGHFLPTISNRCHTFSFKARDLKLCVLSCLYIGINYIPKRACRLEIFFFRHIDQAITLLNLQTWDKQALNAYSWICSPALNNAARDLRFVAFFIPWIGLACIKIYLFRHIDQAITLSPL